MRIKYCLSILICTIVTLPLFAQSNYEMVVESKNGSKTVFKTNDINQVYFQDKDDNDDNDKDCVLKTFYLTDSVKIYQSFAICDSVVYVIVENNADLRNIKAHFTHNGDKVTINGVEQISGKTENDFSDFTAPLHYCIESLSGNSKVYSIILFDIPVITITTENKTPIYNREDWVSANIKLINTDGSVLIDKKVNIRGRGNASWTLYQKKSYSLKFEDKIELFGMNKSKRWILLGHSGDWTKLRTPLSFKISELTKMDWSPSGKNVEFILNDSILCNYFLCEQIRAEKGRIALQEMEPTDTVGEKVTGGYLLEVSKEYDEEYKFMSNTFEMPYMFKSPNDNVHPNQIKYIQSFVDTLESILVTDERMKNGEYEKYMDIDSYIRWWIIHEVTMNREELSGKKNFFMYKDRGYDTKLYAGPPWDFDWGTYWKNLARMWFLKEKVYYAYLFNYPSFVERVKEIWAETKDGFDNTIKDYIEELRVYNRNSVLRDQVYFPNYDDSNLGNPDNGMAYDEAVDYLYDSVTDRIKWMNWQISLME